MTELRVCRRRFLQGVGAAAGSVLFNPLIRARQAAAANQIVWAGWGGDYQGLQSKAFVPPFSKETGIKVVEVASPGNMVAIIKAQVENKNPEWDVVELIEPEVYQLVKLGYLVEITYEGRTKRDYDRKYLSKYAAPFNYYSWILAWNTKNFGGENHPNTWADFWNVQKYPGPRTAMAWYPWVNVEIALMADGVPKDQIYPMSDEKIGRAFQKWKEFRPNIHVWWNSGSQSQQLFSDGEVVLGGVFDGRVRELKKKGQPVDWTFNQGIITPGLWVIPAGSRNTEAASKFINATMRPEPQAHYVRLSQYGATNNKAYGLLTPSEREGITGYGPNFAKQLFLDGRYWAEAWPRYSEAWEKLIAGK